jgi:hypothetical protein
MTHTRKKMKVGDIWYVGSMGAGKGRFPVLIIRLDSHNGCYGLVNGKVRWYRQKDLKKTAELT